jgi:hypothetical protein
VKGCVHISPVQTPAFKCFGYGDKKNPTTLGGQSHGAKFFSGGFEEGCFKSACHSRPLFFNIPGSSRKIYVGIRKK